MDIHTFYLMIFGENEDFFLFFFKGKHEEDYTHGNIHYLKSAIVSVMNLKTVMLLNMRTIIFS